MIARDAETENREEVKLYWIICSYWEPSCQQKRGFEQSYLYYLYESLLTFIFPLSIDSKRPQYFVTAKGFHAVCTWYAAIHQINYINYSFKLITSKDVLNFYERISLFLHEFVNIHYVCHY
jgi:hypothetical protein